MAAVSLQKINKPEIKISKYGLLLKLERLCLFYIFNRKKKLIFTWTATQWWKKDMNTDFALEFKCLSVKMTWKFKFLLCVNLNCNIYYFTHVAPFYPDLKILKREVESFGIRQNYLKCVWKHHKKKKMFYTISIIKFDPGHLMFKSLCVRGF